MAQVSADFATLTDKCASEMVKAIVSDVADLAQTYAPQGQLWSESVREIAAGGGGGEGAGAAASYDLSPSVVETVEVLRDHLWVLANCVHPDLRLGMWRDIARYARALCTYVCVCVCVCVCLDGWMDACMDACMDAWIDREARGQ